MTCGFLIVTSILQRLFTSPVSYVILGVHHVLRKKSWIRPCIVPCSPARKLSNLLCRENDDNICFWLLTWQKLELELKANKQLNVVFNLLVKYWKLLESQMQCFVIATEWARKLAAQHKKFCLRLRHCTGATLRQDKRCKLYERYYLSRSTRLNGRTLCVTIPSAVWLRQNHGPL